MFDQPVWIFYLIVACINSLPLRAQRNESKDYSSVAVFQNYLIFVHDKTFTRRGTCSAYEK